MQTLLKMKQSIAFTIKFLIVLGFTMWAFMQIVPESTKENKNYVEVFSDEEVYGPKY